MTFAQALAGAGHLLTGITSGSHESRERIDAMLPSVDVLDVPALLAQSDLVVLAIPADEIAKSVSGWAALGLFRAGQLVVHTAAEFGIGVLQPAAAAGAIPLAIHPAMRFSGTSLDIARVRDSHFAVTAPAIAVPIALALVIEMGAEPVVIAEDDRAKYFEAISVATTFSGLIVNQAIGLLNQINVAEGRELLSTLLHSSVDGALAEGYQPIEPEDLRG
jgi:predicted short-subunit dehydrogenase-like oxidoreductase (DUF2520 family)